MKKNNIMLVLFISLLVGGNILSMYSNGRSLMIPTNIILIIGIIFNLIMRNGRNKN